MSTPNKIFLTALYGFAYIVANWVAFTAIMLFIAFFLFNENGSISALFLGFIAGVVMFSGIIYVFIKMLKKLWRKAVINKI